MVIERRPYYGPYTADIEAFFERLRMLAPAEAERLASVSSTRSDRDHGVLNAEIQMYAQGEGWAEGLVRAHADTEHLTMAISRQPAAARSAREALTALLAQHFLPAERFIEAYAPFAAVIGWPTAQRVATPQVALSASFASASRRQAA